MVLPLLVWQREIILYLHSIDQRLPVLLFRSSRRHCSRISHVHPAGWHDLPQMGGACGTQWSHHTVWGMCFSALSSLSYQFLFTLPEFSAVPRARQHFHPVNYWQTTLLERQNFLLCVKIGMPFLIIYEHAANMWFNVRVYWLTVLECGYFSFLANSDFQVSREKMLSCWFSVHFSTVWQP